MCKHTNTFQHIRTWLKHSTISGLHGSYARMHTWIKLGYWGKLSKIQKDIVDKQLDYFKCNDKITNETQMNIVDAITSFTNVMREICKGDKGKDLLFSK
jgi:hypothetical protein